MFIYGILSYLPYVALWFVGVCLLLFAYTIYKHRYFERLGIPGPRPSHFLGHLGNINKQGMFQFDRWLATEYGAMAGTFYGNTPALIVSDAEMAGEVCVKQFSKFNERAEPVRIPDQWRYSLNNARGTLWKFLRTVLTPTFSTGKLKNMQPILGKCLKDFTDVVNEKAKAGDNEVDVLKVFSALTMDIICSTSFGIEVNSQKNPDDIFVKHASKILGTSLYNPLLLLNFIFPDIREIITFFGKDYTDKNAMVFLRKTVSMAIEERRKPNEGSRYNDMLKLMMDSRPEDYDPEADDQLGGKLSFEGYKNRGMTDNEVIMNSIIFLAAGFDTTSCALSWTAYCLAMHPECQDKLLEEIDIEIGSAGTLPNYDKLMKMEYLDMILCETLRMFPPALRFNREPTNDVILNGMKIPKGTDITFSTAGIHYNPKYWPEPDVFRPERFSPENKPNIVPYSWIPFGAGPKNCIGQKLALAEIKFGVVMLLQHVRLEPTPGLTLEKVLPKAGILRPDNLKLRFIPRSPN